MVMVPLLATWDLRGNSLINMIRERTTGSDSGEFIVEKGIYNDFNSNWFLDVGHNIFKSMSINAIMPFIEFLLNWSKRYVKRVWD